MYGGGVRQTSSKSAVCSAKSKNSVAAAFTVLAALALAASLLFTACPNNAGGSKPTPSAFAVSFDIEGMPPNGTLEARVDGGSIPSGTIVQRGKIVTFTATPHTNHEVEKWEVNGSVITNTTNTYVCIVTNAVYVKVSFGPLPAGYATYNVEHYQQKADDTYPAAPAEIEILNGEVGTIAAYTPKTGGAYENFTYKPALTQISGTIESDSRPPSEILHSRPSPCS